VDAFNKIEELLAEIKSVDLASKDQLEAFRIKFLGTKNIIKPLFGEIKTVANERKKEFGQAVNALKQEAEAKFNTSKETIEAAADQASKEDMDLSLPSAPLRQGSRHPVSLVMNRMIDIFEKIGFVVAEEREIEDDWHNFTAMNTPEDHPARDMQDTFYLKDSTTNLLRTHTSSVQARVMTTQEPPIRIIDTDIRLRPSYFPFTEPSAEMDVWLGTDTPSTKKLTKGTGWLEVLGCGMVDPNVLKNCNIDPQEYSGYAFGIGIERTAMQNFNISDIRLLFENDVRFLKQFGSVI